jgi:hypothetical protein
MEVELNLTMLVTPDRIADDTDAIVAGLRLLPDWGRRKFCCYQACLAILMHGIVKEEIDVFDKARLLIESGLSDKQKNELVKLESCSKELGEFLDKEYDSLPGILRSRAECYEKTLAAMVSQTEDNDLRAAIWSYEAVEHLGFIEVCRNTVHSSVVTGEQYLAWMREAESTKAVETYLKMINRAYVSLLAGSDVRSLII